MAQHPLAFSKGAKFANKNAENAINKQSFFITDSINVR
jgi:hypothetical protein